MCLNDTQKFSACELVNSRRNGNELCEIDDDEYTSCIKCPYYLPREIFIAELSKNLRKHNRLRVENSHDGMENVVMVLMKSSWENIFDSIRQSEMKTIGNFWTAMQIIKEQLDEIYKE